jgi:putative flippase GtrA
MKKLYKTLENFWFAAVPEKIRFVLVGGFNTAAAYGIFAALYFLFRGHYGLALGLQYVLSVQLSILTMRYYVFQSHGNFWREYWKSAGVYVFLWAINWAWLFLFDMSLGMNALWSQIIFLIVETILMYVLHKYFSFRKVKSKRK